ncbi:MAG: hypothetical protein M1837_004222 [Sclerophora amabilis]|nr:MAG: hypothetical protein M1837_004222 [Sclerophora amabilis]
MAAAVVDIPYLSNYLTVSEQSLSTLSKEPTAELVSSILQAVAAKAREHDETKADKLRLNVELENVVRRGESRARGLKASVDKGLTEVEELRERLRQEESTRLNIESELQNFKSSSSTSTSELETQRSRISSLESSNRDTIALLESKSTAHDRLAEELTAQHQKTLDVRREISTLEQSLQAASSASTTAKFRESNLEQELELVRRNNDWYESELKTKNAELSKTRKEKGARIAELQRQNEDSISTIESLRRTEATLRTRLDEVGEKADNAFSRIQQLQEDAAREQEAFRKELESSQRLAELFEESAKTARDRLQDVQNALEQSKEESAEEMGRIQAEFETCRLERDAADNRVAELEQRTETQEAEIAHIRSADSIPGTPRRDINGASSPGREVGFSPGASRMKGRPSITQMYGEYTSMKGELANVKRQNEALTASMDGMLHDLESKQPEMEELQNEHERLQSEVIEMTSILDEAGKQRDQARKEARKWEGQVEGSQRESDILRQQLRDLSAQIKVLLTEVHARDEGLDALDANDQMQIERLARGELNADDLEDMSDTGRLISQRLTIFKNIEQLQEQNQNLLRITRDLGEKMEGEEALKKQNQQAQDREELQKLREKVDKYKDEMKSMVTKSQSYIKERDMFRRMLQHRGQIGPNSDIASLFGHSVDNGAPTTPNTVMQSVERSGESADFHKTIKELTQHFDSYREEASTDQRALKEQADKLSREKGELQADLARSNSQVTLASERLEMLQSNYGMLKSENSELQKRSHSLAETAARQDLRTQQVAEELVEAKSVVDGMRSEIANLKAEKDFWKKVEKRLSEDNEHLMNERSRLNSLITSVQNLQNERELSDSETRRKLQAQVEAFESELQATKRKLNDEVEDSKKAALRREYEHEQSQKRVEDLVSGLGSVREELVAARTTRDHLQVRVDELSIELKSAEERVHVLQPRPTPRPNVTTTESNQDEANDEDSISREQELAVEISELRRDLELARAEVENSKKDIEKYQEISQSSEEELQSMNDSHDQYREEMDRVLGEKDLKIRDLQQRIEDITIELTNANAEASSLRTEQAETARRVEEQSAAFEVEIARLKDEDERHATAARFRQEDLKAQAEIAQQAQQNYEDELLKHAEAAKALQIVRNDYNQLKTEAVELKTEAEAAQTNLSQNERSWEESKEMYERELSEVRKRREDVDAQNRLLHEQLGNVSKQISALQQHRSISTEEDRGDPSAASVLSDRSVENLQEVIVYLRREKEIVEVQYSLTIRESQRYKQQLDQMQSQLDDTRLKLDQERRVHADGGRNAMTHKELVEKINELNLYRESTITLRNEARQAQTQLAEKSREVEELLEQIQPLRANIRELENVKEVQVGELKLLQDDRDRYQQRMQNILQKYDRVDPAELEALKEQVSSLQTERDALAVEKENLEPLKEQVDKIPEVVRKAQEEAVTPWREQKEKITAQFKERHRTLVNARNEKIAECQSLIQEKEELENQLSALRLNLESANVEKDQAIAASTSQPSIQAQPENATMQNGIETPHTTAEAPEQTDVIVEELQERCAKAESLAVDEGKRSQRLEGEVALHQAKIAELESRITELEQRLNEAHVQVEQLQASQQQPPSSTSLDADSVDELDRLREDLGRAQQEVETLRTHATVSASISNTTAEDGSKPVAQQIAEQVEAVRAELDARQTERIQQAESQFQARADRMKSQLSKKLTEGKDQVKQKLEADHNSAILELQEQHKQDVERITSEHQDEVRRLKEDEATRFEQEKKIWFAESQQTATTETPSSAAVKSEPQTQQLQRPVSEWNISEGQARDLVNTNMTLKSILRMNISTQIKKTKEEQERNFEEKLKGAQVVAQEEKLQALQQAEEVMRKEAELDKEKAVAMEIQRQRVKLSMAEGKARTLTARIDVVQKAVAESPQKPVVEVWDVAKNAKPAPMTPQAPSQTTATQSSPVPPQSAQVPKPALPGTFGQPSQVQPRASPSAAQGSTDQQQKQPPGSISTDSPGSTKQNQPSSQGSPVVATTQPQLQPTTTPAQQSVGGTLPAKPPQGQQQSNSGTGPGALRGIIGQGQSGIPRGGATGRGGRGGRGGQNQGQPPNQRGGANSNVPRGGARGRGQGRGGGNPQQSAQQAGVSPAQTQEGPGGGGAALNASAKQFVPGGNKRSREEGPGENVDGANGTKKPRNAAGQ